MKQQKPGGNAGAPEELALPVLLVTHIIHVDKWRTKKQRNFTKIKVHIFFCVGILTKFFTLSENHITGCGHGLVGSPGVATNIRKSRLLIYID
jgi:hypothetical protein